MPKPDRGLTLDQLLVIEAKPDHFNKIVLTLEMGEVSKHRKKQK